MMNFSDLVKEAHQAIDDNRVDQARVMFECLVDDPLYKGEGFFGLALVEMRQRQFERAKSLLRLALPWVANTAEVIYLAGLCLEHLGRRQAAIDAYRAALCRNPEHAAARSGLDRMLDTEPSYEQQAVARMAMTGVYQ
jgi:tetratricopeptide (TPR) repeat protein